MTEELNKIIILYQTIPPIFFFIGFFGNVMGFVVLLRKNLVNIGARNMFRYLFITDTLFIIQLLIDAITVNFGYNVTVLSKFSCYMYYYLSYTLASISPMLLVYISVERYISIRYPYKKFTLRKKRYQFYYLICVIIFNFVYYSPYLFSFQFWNTEKNETLLYECNFVSLERQKILSLMDLLNRVCLPSFLVTITTHMLLFTIFKSRNRVFKSLRENRHFKRDVRFAFTSIILNIFYVILTFPLPILLIWGKNFSDFTFHLSFLMFYSSYNINFCILIASNSLFRNEFLNMFFNKKNNYRKTREIFDNATARIDSIEMSSFNRFSANRRKISNI